MASHTAVAVSGDEDELALLKVREPWTGRPVVDVGGARRGRGRFEGAEGLGFLLAQHLVTAGETAGDVGRAQACARHWQIKPERPQRRDVRPSDHCGHAICDACARSGNREVLPLLSKRNLDIGRQRSRTVS